MYDKNYNEIQVLQSCLQGNASAFETIVDRYRSMVCAITFSATGLPDRSEELAQNVFINAWKNLHQLKDLDKFRSWLLSITRNVIKDTYKKQSRNVTSGAASIDSIREIPDQSPAPVDQLITKEQLAVVADSLASLPEKYREPVVLFYRQGKSVKQVADTLAISEDAVKTRLHRGRKLLKERIVSMVEDTLSKTAPGKAFTAGVMATVTGIAVKTTAAAGIASGTAAVSGVSTLLGTATAKIAATILIAAAVTVGTVTVYKISKHNNTSPQAVVLQGNEASGSSRSEQNLENRAPTDRQLENILPKDTHPEMTDQKDIDKTVPDVIATVQEEVFDGDIITLKVIDKETGLPIAGAPLRTYPAIEDNPATGSDGIYKVKIPTGFTTSINLFAKPVGYVWQSFSCGQGRFIDYFPKEVVFELDRGTVIGGVIYDPNSNPLEGATVSFECVEGLNDKHPDTDLRFRQVTGPDGRWQCISAPKDIRRRCTLAASHPEYTTKGVFDIEVQIAEQLRAQTHVLKMNTGFSLTGTVTDPDGNPIKGARVQLGEWWGANERASRTYTDENGFYYFDNRNNSKEYVTVTANGFAPELKVTEIKDADAVADFILDTGGVVYGRVVDTHGNPIAGATVRADDFWYDYPHGIRSLDWLTKTDSDGKFTWQHAPEETVELMIYADDYMTLEQKNIVPSDTEYEFVLYEKLRVTGQVRDAVSKEPITDFSFERHEGGTISSPKRIVDSQGRFETAFDDQGDKYTIQFEAEGYKPTSSKTINLGEQDVELLVEMHPDGGIDGTLVDVNDVPVSDATVIIPDFILNLDNMTYNRSSLKSHPNTITDSAGKFHFAPVAKQSYHIAVFEENGYVYISSEEIPADGKIVLLPYAKIVGDYYIGSKSVADTPIRLDYPDYQMKQNNGTVTMGDLSINCKTVTDKDGKFVFDKLIHGRARILIDPYKHIEVQSGQTHEVYIGGDGLTVTGKILTPQGELLKEDFGSCSLTLQRYFDEMPIPEEDWILSENADAMSYSELTQWYENFINSDQGQQWFDEMKSKYSSLNEYYSFKPDSNGKFDKPNVKPGKYLLTAEVRPWINEKVQPKDLPKRIDYEKGFIARAAKVVTVPEYYTPDEMNIPVDVGTIECISHPLKAGDKAPNFVINKLKADGQIKLSDYKGRMVLVNFTNPALAEIEPEKMQTLTQVCSTAISAGDIEVINVVFETTPWDYMRKKLIPECKLDGTYGIAQFHNSKIYHEYGVGQLPISVVINNDGKILYKGKTSLELFDILPTDK